jgi:hypothetical protein
VPKHVRVHPGQVDAGLVGQVVQPAGRGVPVHPSILTVPQDQALFPVVDGAGDSALHGRWQRGQDDLAAFAVDLQHPVAVLLTQVLDVRAGRGQWRAGEWSWTIVPLTSQCSAEHLIHGGSRATGGRGVHLCFDPGDRQP